MLGLAVSPATAHAAEPVDNPPLPTACGLDIAVVLDLSGSLSSGDVRASKEAAAGFVTALQGTPSSVGVYTFSSTGATVIDKTAVTDAGGADTVRTAINGIIRTGGNTNWQAGFRAVPGQYEVIVFITDGEPNRPVGTDPLDAGIAAANDHKTDGTFVI